MALALPLSILDASGTASSIARFTDGNATPPKSLNTLGASEGQALPRKISCWNGCVDATSVKMCILTESGSYGSSTHTKNSCLCYNPALAGGQSWRACFCWILRAYGDGGTGCACFNVKCGLTTKASCFISRSSSPSLNCSGTFWFTITSIDQVTACNCSRTSSGAYFANSYSYVCMFCSAVNVGGTVVICQPDGQGTYAVCSGY